MKLLWREALLAFRRTRTLSILSVTPESNFGTNSPRSWASASSKVRSTRLSTEAEEQQEEPPPRCCCCCCCFHRQRVSFAVAVASPHSPPGTEGTLEEEREEEEEEEEEEQSSTAETPRQTSRTRKATSSTSTAGVEARPLSPPPLLPAPAAKTSSLSASLSNRTW